MWAGLGAAACMTWLLLARFPGWGCAAASDQSSCGSLLLEIRWGMMHCRVVDVLQLLHLCFLKVGPALYIYRRECLSDCVSTFFVM
jgi:hypothetical protein